MRRSNRSVFSTEPVTHAKINALQVPGEGLGGRADPPAASATHTITRTTHTHRANLIKFPLTAGEEAGHDPNRFGTRHKKHSQRQRNAPAGVGRFA